MKKDLWEGVLLLATAVFLVFKMVDYAIQASIRMQAVEASNHITNPVQALFSTTGYAEDLYAALLSFTLSLIALALSAYCFKRYLEARNRSQRPYYAMAVRLKSAGHK